jgi:hypothetical protein
MKKEYPAQAPTPWERLVGMLYVERTTINYILLYAILIGRRFKFQVQFRSLERTELEIKIPKFYEVCCLIDPGSNLRLIF